MRILVTGSNGMLGTAIKQVFLNHELILTTSLDLDVRNIPQVMSYESRDLDLILHLAAETDLLKAESNPSQAYLINQTGTQNMVELARLLNIPLVYIGTAGIFNGGKKAHTEADLPKPIHHYGRSKYYGEIAVRSYPKHFIIRSGWGMGGGPEIDKKFISKMFQQIQKGQKKLYAVKDIYGNPTYTIDLAKTIKNVIESKIEYGIYHSGGKGSASRYQVLTAFLKFLGLSKKIEVIPVTNQEFLSLFPISTPPTGSEILSSYKIDKTQLSAMRDWDTALFDYAKQFRL